MSRAEQNHRKRDQINSFIEIIKGYISTIKRCSFEPEDYRHEVCFFKEVIKGLIIDEELGYDFLEKHGRSVYLAVYKEHIEELGEGYRDLDNVLKIFKRWYDNKLEIRNNLFYMDCIPEVKLVIALYDMGKKRWNIDRAARMIEKKFREVDKILSEK